MRKVVRITQGCGKPRKQPRRMTPEVLTELLMVHANCTLDQKGKCPLMLFVRALCWEINLYCNIASDEDRGFKRHSEMLAARPLNRIMECFCEEADKDGDFR